MIQVESFNMAFALCPTLTAGATEALRQHGSEELRQRYLPKLVSGAWTGTMNLTEPQAGSDLAAVRTKAVPEGVFFARSVGGVRCSACWPTRGRATSANWPQLLSGQPFWGAATA